MRLGMLTVLCAVLAVSFAAHADNSGAPKQQPVKTMKIRMVVDGKAVTATLADNPTSRDFYSMLPMTLMLSDHANTEKVAYLPRKLSKAGAPAGAKPEIGDIAYYAPWGNLAIYYKAFAYSDGLIKLGTISTYREAFKVAGSLKVTIEPMPD